LVKVLLIVGVIVVAGLLYGSFMVYVGRFSGFNKLPPG